MSTQPNQSNQLTQSTQSNQQTQPNQGASQLSHRSQPKPYTGRCLSDARRHLQEEMRASQSYTYTRLNRDTLRRPNDPNISQTITDGHSLNLRTQQDSQLINRRGFELKNDVLAFTEEKRAENDRRIQEFRQQVRESVNNHVTAGIKKTTSDLSQQKDQAPTSTNISSQHRTNFVPQQNIFGNPLNVNSSQRLSAVQQSQISNPFTQKKQQEEKLPIIKENQSDSYQSEVKQNHAHEKPDHSLSNQNQKTEEQKIHEKNKDQQKQKDQQLSKSHPIQSQGNATEGQSSFQTPHQDEQSNIFGMKFEPKIQKEPTKTLAHKPFGQSQEQFSTGLFGNRPPIQTQHQPANMLGPKPFVQTQEEFTKGLFGHRPLFQTQEQPVNILTSKQPAQNPEQPANRLFGSQPPIQTQQQAKTILAPKPPAQTQHEPANIFMPKPPAQTQQSTNIFAPKHPAQNQGQPTNIFAPKLPAQDQGQSTNVFAVGQPPQSNSTNIFAANNLANVPNMFNNLKNQPGNAFTFGQNVFASRQQNAFTQNTNEDDDENGSEGESGDDDELQESPEEQNNKGDLKYEGYIKTEPLAEVQALKFKSSESENLLEGMTMILQKVPNSSGTQTLQLIVRTKAKVIIYSGSFLPNFKPTLTSKINQEKGLTITITNLVQVDENKTSDSERKPKIARTWRISVKDCDTSKKFIEECEKIIKSIQQKQ